MSDKKTAKSRLGGSLERQLTRRYLLGLLIVASLLLTTYFVLVNQISANADSARLINIAGKQRMLSQRIALSATALAPELSLPLALRQHNDEQKQASFEVLSSSLRLMRQGHQEFLTRAEGGAASAAERELYVGSGGLAVRVDAFMAAGGSIVSEYRNDSLKDLTRSSAWIEVATAGDDRLLADLDAMVALLQRDAEIRIDTFLRLETLFLAIGLIMLSFEALLIFRPMVKRAVDTLAELEVANDEMREFSFRISHDLRAPIASSLGLARIASDAIESEDQALAGQTVTRIERSMERLDTLIGDILRVTRHKEPPNINELVQIAPLVDQIFDKLQHMPGAELVEMRNAVAASVVLKSNALFVAQILENLISNSIKYRDPESAQCCVAVAFEGSGSNGIISVVDNGLGIPPNYREDVFGMFKRFHPKVSFGTGLGLYLTVQNAKTIGGRVTYSPEQQGSRFSLHLPLRS